jgi:hypothetical protein
MTVANNIYQKQIKYHVFNTVTNSELTELVPLFTTRPAFPTSVKKVNTSFKNVCSTWGPTLLADLMIFCPLGLIGPTNFKNSGVDNDVPTLKNFYRSPFSKWSPQYRTNSTLSDFNDISYVSRLLCSRIDSWHRKISTSRHFQNGRHNTAQIQHCSISTS